MYSFGKEIRDLKEAENVAIEKIDNGEFDNFLNEVGLNRDFLIENIKIEECYTLGIGYDIELDYLFENQQAVTDEINQRESYSNNSLIVGTSAIYLEDTESTIYGYFISSEAFSKTYTDKMLLLAISFVLSDSEDFSKDIKQTIIL